jgi:hypothetical protein
LAIPFYNRFAGHISEPISFGGIQLLAYYLSSNGFGRPAKLSLLPYAQIDSVLPFLSILFY